MLETAFCERLLTWECLQCKNIHAICFRGSYSRHIHDWPRWWQCTKQAKMCPMILIQCSPCVKIRGFQFRWFKCLRNISVQCKIYKVFIHGFWSKLGYMYYTMSQYREQILWNVKLNQRVPIGPMMVLLSTATCSYIALIHLCIEPRINLNK